MAEGSPAKSLADQVVEATLSIIAVRDEFDELAKQEISRLAERKGLTKVKDIAAAIKVRQEKSDETART